MDFETNSNFGGNEIAQPSGLVVACAWCKKVQEPNGVWSDITDAARTELGFHLTHGICGGCYAKARAPLAALR